jgi:hypothetical protein
MIECSFSEVMIEVEAYKHKVQGASIESFVDILMDLSFEIECFSYFSEAQVDCAVLFAIHTAGVSKCTQ